MNKNLPGKKLIDNALLKTIKINIGEMNKNLKNTTSRNTKLHAET